jgi:hypothetical protein
MAQDSDKWGAYCEDGNALSASVKGGVFFLSISGSTKHYKTHLAASRLR